jgi:uncharacterized membrane protein
VVLLITGLLIFLGVHSISIVAPATRDRWAAAMGSNAWRGVYSLIAVAGFVLVIYGYGLARQSPTVLYVPPPWLRQVAMLLMLPVFPLLIAAYIPGRIKSAVKHPMLLAVKTWALAHLLANGMLADVLLFGGFLAWAVADRISLKHRLARPVKEAPSSRWNDAIAIIGGLALYALTLCCLHRLLIGMPLL